MKQEQVRYFFSDSYSIEPDIRSLSQALQYYAENSEKYGKNTSLVVFFKPCQNHYSHNEYEYQFWSILQNLHEVDEIPWPSEISKDPNHYLWEFCFHGVPMFVVCNNPAHTTRKSRYASTFMITFQPRWVFEFLKEPVGQKSKEAVREILKIYDDIDVHPELGSYGHKNNKEWRQYYLSDTNDIESKKCPFQVKEKNY